MISPNCVHYLWCWAQCVYYTVVLGYMCSMYRTVINESSLSPLLFFYYHICVGSGFLSQKYLCNIDYTLPTISTTLQQDTYLTYLTMPTRKVFIHTYTIHINIYIHMQERKSNLDTVELEGKINTHLEVPPFGTTRLGQLPGL